MHPKELETIELVFKMQKKPIVLVVFFLNFSNEILNSQYLSF